VKTVHIASEACIRVEDNMERCDVQHTEDYISFHRLLKVVIEVVTCLCGLRVEILLTYMAKSSHGEGCIGTGPCSDPGHFAARCAYRSYIVEHICLDI
jgi:hypothetical protein